MNNIAYLVLSALPRVRAFSRFLMKDGKVKHSPFFSSLSVAAGFPVSLFPALLDHVMSFLLLYGATRYISWSDSHEVTTFLTLDNVYILVCTDCLVLSDVYIPLVVRIGLFRPNKRLFTSGLHLILSVSSFVSLYLIIQLKFHENYGERLRTRQVNCIVIMKSSNIVRGRHFNNCNRWRNTSFTKKE